MSKKTLDDAQIVAVNHVDGPFLCIAGPGSGKTTVIVNRVKHLVEVGIDPSSILVVTFSKAAAEEMGARYAGLPGSVPGPAFSTIHSFAFAVLRYARGYTARNILADSRQRWFVLDQIRNHDAKVKSYASMKKMAQNVIGDLSAYRNVEYGEPFEPKAFRNKRDFMVMLERYEKFKESEHAIDYDDMLFLCRDVFREEPEILRLYQDHFRYIMVDEFQDTSAVQAEILYTLAKPDNNIFICGDDDQSIYKFRGARPDIMLQFPKEYPGCGISKLSTNYRSDINIVKGAGNLIGHNKTRFSKSIRGKSTSEGLVSAMNIKSTDSLFQKVEDLVKKEAEHTPYEEIAVLCRTNREVSSFARWFSDHDIPFYCTVPLENPHDTFAFKTMMQYLSIVYRDDSWAAITPILNKPYRQISRAAISKSKSMDELLMHVDGRVMKNVYDLKRVIRKAEEMVDIGESLADVAEYISNAVDFHAYINDACEYQYADEDEQIAALTTSIMEMKDFTDLDAYEEQVTREDAKLQEIIKAAANGIVNGVTLSTLHRAKGLEYDCVIITSCNYGNIPYKRQDEELDPVSEEEERRLMYVGVTRARKQCYVLYLDDVMPSNYLHELLPEESFVWDPKEEETEQKSFKKKTRPADEDEKRDLLHKKRRRKPS